MEGRPFLFCFFSMLFYYFGAAPSAGLKPSAKRYRFAKLCKGAVEKGQLS